MKIVLCCRVYSTHGRLGGMIHVVQERAEALARAGHDVTIITTRQNLTSKHQVVQSVDGVRILHCPTGTPKDYDDDFAKFCDQECRGVQPLDILHLDSWDKSRLWWHSRPGNPKRIAVTNHGEAVGSQLTDWRLAIHNRSAPVGFDVQEWVDERNALKAADAVIATCRFDRWMLSDLLGLGKKVKLVRNPLAPWHFEGRDWIRSHPNVSQAFLCVGLWGKAERGFDLAEQACQLVGAELHQPVNVPRRDLLKFHDRCDALLLPTFQSKGFDLSVAESVGRLRPVLCSDNGINTMEAVDKPWMVLHPVGDAEALAECLRKPLPVVPESAADEHRPEVHVQRWLEAIGA